MIGMPRRCRSCIVDSPPCRRLASFCSFVVSIRCTVSFVYQTSCIKDPAKYCLSIPHNFHLPQYIRHNTLNSFLFVCPMCCSLGWLIGRCCFDRKKLEWSIPHINFHSMFYNKGLKLLDYSGWASIFLELGCIQCNRWDIGLWYSRFYSYHQLFRRYRFDWSTI